MFASLLLLNLLLLELLRYSFKGSSRTMDYEYCIVAVSSS